MLMRFVLLLVVLTALPARAVTPAAEEFMVIVKKLEPVLCERRKLRRDILMAQAEQNTIRTAELRARYAALGRDPQTAKLEQRLGELQLQVTDDKGHVRDPDDLRAIGEQQRELYARCE